MVSVGDQRFEPACVRKHVEMLRISEDARACAKEALINCADTAVFDEHEFHDPFLGFPRDRRHVDICV